MNLVSYEQYRETKRHGTASFAYNTYLCTIPDDFSHVPQHWHDEMEIIYIKKGCGTVQVDLQSYQVQQGWIVLVAPGALHAIDGEQKVGARMEYENIIFSLSILDAKDDWCRSAYFMPLQDGRLRLPTVLQPEMHNYEQVAACIDRADAVCAAKPEGYPLYVKAQLFTLLFLVYTPCETQKTQAHATGQTSERIKQALRFVEENYASKLTVSVMAMQCCCSQSHFMRFFKEAVNVPFVAYLNDYRLGMAARMLTETHNTVLEIAQSAGFENISYFNRCFKQKYDTTPSNYRYAFDS